jgi:hypothetical protein
MDRSDVTSWAKRFAKISYSAGQANVILQMTEMFNHDDAPRVPFDLITLANNILEQVARKMKHLPPDQLKEIISWEKGIPLHLRSSLTLEESVILDDFKNIVDAIQKFAALQERVRVWHLQRLPKRDKRKVRRVK